QNNKRSIFSNYQLEKLEERFLKQSFLSREERVEFADVVGLTERQVLIWFQNRR
ncbi:hypothetical protein HELRODRAFT_84858, partial [Helobdella robusta]|uniref:Homeobox domain-containing protein n=1 Tax=Helobdella robusta TaxID=6412 RepID=T1G5P6_HELRO